MDLESNRRYEVEIQLGRTDESHIIRTIEYWDMERKRYPQFDHCAVIIAEDIEPIPQCHQFIQSGNTIDRNPNECL